MTRNTSYLTLALVLQKVISFTYFTILARNLGPENLGKYYFAASFAAIFAIAMDFGLVNVLTREVAKTQREAKKLLGSVIALKLPLSLLVAGAIVISAHLLHYDPLVMSLIYISLFCVILDSFTVTFFGVVRGFHNLIFESISSVVFQLILMGAGLFFIYSGFSLVWVMSAALAASAFNFIFSSLVLKKKIGVPIWPIYDWPAIGKIVAIAIPFGVYGVFQRFYTYFDTVLLKSLAGDKYVGFYQIPSKIIIALQFIPMAFTASLYPAMSNYWVNNKKQLAVSFEKALIYLAIVSLPISAGIIALADKIILIFRTDYNESILPLQIIIVSVFFIFINFPIGSLLNACDRQKNNTMNMAIVTVFTVILDIALIPPFKVLGASVAVVISSAAMTVLGLYWSARTIEFNWLKIGWGFLKTLAAAVIMGLAAYYLKGELNVFLVAPIGALIYIGLLFAFKTIGQDEVRHVLNSFLKK